VTPRIRLLLGWSAIGLKVVDGRSARSVLGWEVRASGPEFLLLGADSRIGMPGELLFKPGRDALLFATLSRLADDFAQSAGCSREPCLDGDTGRDALSLFAFEAAAHLPFRLPMRSEWSVGFDRGVFSMSST
jgi:hypothetical protein